MTCIINEINQLFLQQFYLFTIYEWIILLFLEVIFFSGWIGILSVLSDELSDDYPLSFKITYAIICFVVIVPNGFLTYIFFKDMNIFYAIGYFLISVFFIELFTTVLKREKDILIFITVAILLTIFIVALNLLPRIGHPVGLFFQNIHHLLSQLWYAFWSLVSRIGQSIGMFFQYIMPPIYSFLLHQLDIIIAPLIVALISIYLTKKVNEKG